MNDVFNYLQFFSLIITIFYMVKIRKTVKKGSQSMEALTKNEKILIWIICFLNPIASGAIYYFGWIKRLPQKAKQANKISWIALILLIIVSAISSFIVIMLE